MRAPAHSLHRFVRPYFFCFYSIRFFFLYVCHKRHFFFFFQKSATQSINQSPSTYIPYHTSTNPTTHHTIRYTNPLSMHISKFLHLDSFQLSPSIPLHHQQWRLPCCFLGGEIRTNYFCGLCPWTLECFVRRTYNYLFCHFNIFHVAFSKAKSV